MKPPVTLLLLFAAMPAFAQVMGTGVGPSFGQQFGGRDPHPQEQRCFNRHHTPDERVEACRHLVESGDRNVGPVDMTEAFRLAGQYENALAVLDPTLKTYPTYAQYLEERAIIYVSLNKPDLALADADAAVAATPDRNEAYTARCRVRALAGEDLDKALADCSKSLSIDRNDTDAMEARGLASFRLADFKSAIADEDSAASGDSGNAEARYIRGLAKTRSGDTDGGAADIDRAKDIDPYIADELAIFGVKP